MNLDIFRQTLTNLISDNNELRLKAEQEFKDLSSILKLQLLIFILRERTDSPEILQLSSVLLRRFFRLIVNLDLKEFNNTFKPYKDELINILKQPMDLNLKKKIADAAAEFMRKLIISINDDPEYQWPEFLNYLSECIVSPESSNKEIALSVISYAPLVLNKQLAADKQCVNLLKQFFLFCLRDSNQTSIAFRVEAAKSVGSFIICYNDESEIIKAFYEITLHLINIIIATMPLEEDYCDSVLKVVQDLAEKCSTFIKPNFDPLFRLCVETLLNNNIEEGRRYLCLEIITSLAEEIPSTIRKRAKQYLPQIVSHLLLMMTDIDDDLEAWTNSDEATVEDYDSSLVISETSLDRLASALGGKTILPLALQNISNMCRNTENWKYRHAGLMALATIGEGCHDQMLKMLNELVEGIVPFLEDDHPKIRYAACNVIGQMATDFSSTFQDKFHHIILPKLLLLFSTNDNPRVQAHAAAAMVNFIEGCSQNIIKQHIDLMAEKMQHVLSLKMSELAEKGKKLVLEQTIVTLSSLADSAQEHFVKYYDKFFPMLKYIIENALSDDLKVLRGKTIECISLIGLAVGKEKFCQDASDIMNLLLRTQTGELKFANDDPQLVYMIASWTRICKLLGSDFEPYLPYVMPSILKVASLKIEVTLLDKEDIAEVEDDDNVQCLDSGEETFSIKTAGLEEKATACQMITCYARELKYAFANYVEETVKMMVPLLNFYFHERIRTAAAESLFYLIESGKVKGETFIKNMWDYIYPELLKSIELEPEKDVLCEMMTSLSACIETLGKEMITEEQINRICQLLMKYLEEHFINAEERLYRRNDEDYDEGVEETLINEDDEDCYVLSKISEIIHSLFIVFNENFLPYFETLLPQFFKLAEQDRSLTEVQWAICVMDDLIEFTGPHSIKYKDFFIPLFLNGMRSEHPEIRQASAYGWGVIGKHGGEAFAQQCAASIPVLIQMIQSPDSRLEGNNLATENAISSVTKIMQYNNSCLNVNEIIPLWFSWLPAWEDETELPYIYDFLLILIENKHPAIVGENNANLPQILAIIAEVLCRNAIESNSEIGQKIIFFLKSLTNDMAFFGQCLEKLNLAHVQQIRQVVNI